MAEDACLIPVRADKDNIINAIRPEVKAAGLMDSRDNWYPHPDRTADRSV